MIAGFVGSYRFLSNFWYCRVEYKGLAFTSVEAAYQAAKSADPDTRKRFTTLRADESKKLGREIEVRSDWTTDEKLRVMTDLLKQKFGPANPHLAKELLATGDEEIVELNYWRDRFWGVCQGKGENHLGRLLMERRKELKAEHGS